MNRFQSTNTVASRTFLTGKCPKSLHVQKRGVKRGGQTTVELALILLPFFVLLFAIVDFAQIYFYDNSLQNGLREATRFATAGRIIQTTNGDGSAAYETNFGIILPKAITEANGTREASRNECIRYWFLSNCIIQIPISQITIISASSANGEPYLSNDGRTLLGGYSVTTNGTLVTTNAVVGTSKGPGSQDDYIQITATNTIKTITPLFGYLSGYDGRAGLNNFACRVSAIAKNEPAKLNFLHTNMYSDEP